MVRERNEDSYMVPAVDQRLLHERGYLFAVADGMGGYGDGHKASQASLRALYDAFYGAEPLALPDAIQLANMAVRRLAMQPENDARLGTTLVAALFRDDSILVAHVGDSRAYLVRDGKIWQVTTDHSAVQEQAAAGSLSVTWLDRVPGKNIVTRAIGQHEIVPADYTPVTELMQGDTLVLCSDGLTNLVEDHAIAQIVSANEPQQAADMLVSLANRRGGHDNVTIQLIRITALPFRPAPSSAVAPGALRPGPSRQMLALLGVVLLIVIALSVAAIVR